MPSQEASELSTAVGVSPLNEASSEIRWSRQPALVLTPEVPPSSPELLATLPPETSEKMEESLYGYSFGFDTEPSASGVQPEHRSCVSGTNINHPLMPMLPTQAVVPSATPSTYFEHSTSLSVASTLPSTSLTADTQSHVFPHDDSLLYLDAATGQVDWLADVAALDAHAAQCRPILAHFGGSIPPGHSNGVRYPPAGQDSQNMVHHDRSSYPSQQSSWNTGAQAYPPAPAEPMAIPPSNSFYGSSYEASSGRMASGTRARRDYRAVPYHQGLAPTAFPV
ncbi:hypothetical protein BKA62DRAFT_71680 [Auriculariales sp. MPI-PUGE-AT-0066]|nr:hypothetical protein BKA62DRAFT_71680 [Auriculariales sp. MPI-PUGE-AT-0066]